MHIILLQSRITMHHDNLVPHPAEFHDVTNRQLEALASYEGVLFVSLHVAHDEPELLAGLLLFLVHCLYGVSVVNPIAIFLLEHRCDHLTVFLVDQLAQELARRRIGVHQLLLLLDQILQILLLQPHEIKVGKEITLQHFSLLPLQYETIINLDFRHGNLLWRILFIVE